MLSLDSLAASNPCLVAIIALVISIISKCLHFALVDTYASFARRAYAILTKSFIDMLSTLCTLIKLHALLTPFTRSHMTSCSHLIGPICCSTLMKS